MTTSRPHLSSIPGAPDVGTSDPSSALRRDVALAFVVAALLALGVALGGTISAKQEPLLAQQTEIPAAQPSQEFVYFPSQYVNQGVETSEVIPTF